MKTFSRPFVRTPFNYDTDAVSSKAGLQFTEPTMAQQQFKDECDINVIAERFGLTGQLPVNGRMATYADFEGVHDFQTAMNTVRHAQEAFMQLPALIRERFGHNPQKFVEFCSNPANLDEARKLGLVPSPPIPASQPAADPPPSPM